KACGKLVLLPDRRPSRFVERMDRALVVGDIKVAAVDGDAAQARKIARPDPGAADQLETGDATLICGGARLPLLDDRRAGDISDPLELRRSLGGGDACFPAKRAGGEIERQQLAAGGAGEQRAATGGAARK